MQNSMFVNTLCIAMRGMSDYNVIRLMGAKLGSEAINFDKPNELDSQTVLCISKTTPIGRV